MSGSGLLNAEGLGVHHMHKITPLALLITGSFAGQANATTEYFDVGSSFEGTAITIGAAAAPQYTYQTVKPNYGGTEYYFQTASPSSYLTTLSDASDVPNAGSYFYQGSYKVDGVSDQVGLRFKIDAQTFYGVARFESTLTTARGDSATSFAEDPLSPRLVQIDYQLASVPEPESWAMLIAGMGVAGAAVRRSRRRAALVTA